MLDSLKDGVVEKPLPADIADSLTRKYKTTVVFPLLIA